VLSRVNKALGSLSGVYASLGMSVGVYLPGCVPRWVYLRVYNSGVTVGIPQGI